MVPVAVSLLGGPWGGGRAAFPGVRAGMGAVGQMAVRGPRPLHSRASGDVRPAREAVSSTDSLTDSSADSARLATITTDTGAFAPGRRDFTRYTVPALCLVAARDVQRIARRSVAAKIARVQGLDTVGAGQTASLMRRCAARFTVAGTAARDLPVLLEVALYAQDDSLAQAVATRWNDPDDAIALYLTFDHVMAAEAVVAQVDARGPSAFPEQIRLHDQLVQAFARLHDTAGLRREIGRVVTLARTLRASHDESIARSIQDAYRTDMRVNVLTHPDSLPILAEQAQQDLRSYAPGESAHWFDWAPYGQLTTAQLLAHLAPEWYVQQWQHPHPAVSRLQADYVFPPPGGSDAVLPVPGKINLICSGGIVAGETNLWQQRDTHGFTESSDYGDADYWQAKNLRRWVALYGAAGLAVTVVREARGWAYMGVPYYPGNPFFPSGAAEARTWQWYEQVYDSLPVTVAVQVIHARRLPPPDERLVESDTGQFVQAFLTDNYMGKRDYDNFNQCTVIDREGKQLLQTSPISNHNQDLDDFLRWLFTQGGTVAGHGSSAVGTPRQASSSTGASLPLTHQDHDHP
jgi:hypothetical protein